MKAAIYARVSTKDQSNEIQLEGLRKFAALRNYEIYEEYVDVITGDFSKRKEEVSYDRLMKDAESKKFDVVLVWKFDRFARSLIHLMEALNTFKKLGVGFISSNEQFDTTSPLGEFVFQMLGAVAELERKMIYQRCDDGRKAAIM